MATIDYTITNFPDAPEVLIITWAGMVNGDVGRPIEFMNHADRTVHVVGTFDTTTVVLEGSNNGTDYATLDNRADAALSVTATALEGVRDLARYTRPSITAGGASTDITVILLVRRNRL